MVDVPCMPPTTVGWNRLFSSVPPGMSSIGFPGIEEVLRHRADTPVNHPTSRLPTTKNSPQRASETRRQPTYMGPLSW